MTAVPMVRPTDTTGRINMTAMTAGEMELSSVSVCSFAMVSCAGILALSEDAAKAGTDRINIRRKAADSVRDNIFFIWKDLLGLQLYAGIKRLESDVQALV